MPTFKLVREANERVHGLTRAEFERLLGAVREHLADMAVFAVPTGLRQDNVKRLEWQYVDLERGHAWIPAGQHKNLHVHAVPLNAVALAALT